MKLRNTLKEFAIINDTADNLVNIVRFVRVIRTDVVKYIIKSVDRV